MSDVAPPGRSVPAAGYFAYLELPEKHRYCGGLLVVDRYSMPLEFRATEPVTATAVQRMLYGAVWFHALICEVIGESLWNATEHKPPLILIADERLLSVVRPDDVPAALVDREGSVSRVQWPGNAPVDVKETSGAGGEDPDGTGAVLSAIEEFRTVFDIAEPFARVEALLGEMLSRMTDRTDRDAARAGLVAQIGARTGRAEE